MLLKPRNVFENSTDSCCLELTRCFFAGLKVCSEQPENKRNMIILYLPLQIALCCRQQKLVRSSISEKIRIPVAAVDAAAAAAELSYSRLHTQKGMCCAVSQHLILQIDSIPCSDLARPDAVCGPYSCVDGA